MDREQVRIRFMNDDGDEEIEHEENKENELGEDYG
jgi:hypothetical protein